MIRISLNSSLLFNCCEIAFEKICEKIGEGGKWYGGFEFDFGIDEEGEIKITVDFWTTLS